MRISLSLTVHNDFERKAMELILNRLLAFKRPARSEAKAQTNKVLSSLSFPNPFLSSSLTLQAFFKKCN
jgi:hypothetical protein